MDSQKIENLLNLSLSVSKEEREESPLLREGFDLLSNTWEIIIKYQGDIERYETDLIKIEPLIAGYAIVTLPDALLEEFVALPEIEYVEKPKPFYFQDITALRESCISTVTEREPFLRERECWWPYWTALLIFIMRISGMRMVIPELWLCGTSR